MKKKVCSFVAIFYLTIAVFSLTTEANASEESDALVNEGCVLLFGTGGPTCSGILAANLKFEAAVNADLDDQKANLFYAVTRVLAFGLEQSGGAGLETLADLLGAFGINRNDIDSLNEGSPFNDIPEIYDSYNPPATIPGGEAMRAFLAEQVMTVLDAAIDNLNKVDGTFTTTLPASVTGETYDTEVDYGDVLLFKSALYTFKSVMLLMTAYNLDIDIKEIIVLGNADMLQFQRDFLTKYQDVLKLRTDGTASLHNAKTALLSAIDTWQATFAFITAESDGQENDLFYFDSAEDQREAEFLLTQLAELENSLSENRPATFTVIEETWIVTDTTTNDQIEIEIEKDVDGKFVIGDYWFLNIGYEGVIESFSVSGSTVTFELSYEGMDPWSVVSTGTISADGTSISSGSYTKYDDMGNPVSNGNFIATRQNQETETETIDFNLVFGNSGKSPLDIRAILPEFDQYNEIIPGAFPGEPVLNGIMPGITNDILTAKLELQPSGEFLIPTQTINVQDGSIADWSDIVPVFTDITGEDEYEFTGDDITALYLAKDTEFLYIRMTLAENPNTLAPDVNGGSMHYFVQLARNRHASGWSDRYFGVKYNSGNWEVMVHKNEGQEIFGDHPSEFAQAVGNELEWKVPLSELELPFTGSYLNTWSHWTPGSYDCSDGNQTKLRVGPLASITGEIDCSAYASGKIFIYAQDASTGEKLEKTYITSTGIYSIVDLPEGAAVNIFTCWDADDNGIKTFGDYIGMTGPITVASGGTTGADFSINMEIDDSFVMTKPGVYRVFGSNDYTFDPAGYQGPWDPNEVDWGNIWTFIGESNQTETFNAAEYYKNILIIYGEEPVFNFDAFEDLTAGTAFATDEAGNTSESNWITSGLRNFDDYSFYNAPSYFKGHPDNLYAVTCDWYGFSLFTMPDDSTDNTSPRQLKLTLASPTPGDVDGDGDTDLADAILALKVINNGSDQTVINPLSDVNGDQKLGLAEVIYILQIISEIRYPEPEPEPEPVSKVNIEGHVYESGTNNPISGAVVSTSLDEVTVATDSNGHFFLQTITDANYATTPYTITISASGYTTYSENHSWGDHPSDQVFYLSSF